MYLVRSLKIEQLSAADKLRRNLITHFSAPYSQNEERVKDQRNLCESDFERDMYDELTQRGYWITPQVQVGRFRIDLVAEGNNDARLAIECDGDRYHGPDKWADDMQRQRILERAGWVFWRCFASTYVRRRHEIMAELVRNLEMLGIEPMDPESVPRSIHTEHRIYRSTPDETAEEKPSTLLDVDTGEVDEDASVAVGTRAGADCGGKGNAEGRECSRRIHTEHPFCGPTSDDLVEQTFLTLSDGVAGEVDEDATAVATAAVGIRAGVEYDCNRNAEGRDCLRRITWRGYVIPRVRPPRGMATPEGFDVSHWMEREWLGRPTYCVRDAFNVKQVRMKGINHTSMRSLCVAGVAFAEQGGGAFDPAAHHFFIIDGDHTFIVW